MSGSTEPRARESGESEHWLAYELRSTARLLTFILSVVALALGAFSGLTGLVMLFAGAPIDDSRSAQHGAGVVAGLVFVLVAAVLAVPSFRYLRSPRRKRFASRN